MKWLSKRFTVMVIPDANASVKRYPISGLWFALVPAVILLLAICSALFISLFSNNAGTVRDLKSKLSAMEAGHIDELKTKEDTIAALEADLSTLSNEAKGVEDKLAAISQLELELKEIAGIEKTTVRVSSGSEDGGGQGGQEFNLEDDTLEPGAKETIQQFQNLSAQMDALAPSLDSTIKALHNYRQLLRITPTIWPADSRKITSTFGVRSDPFTGRSSLHSGLDLGGNRGDAIYAAADGVITLSENTYPHGNNIIIDHGRGIETRYLHLNERLVKVGDKVKKGQLIGELGNTGRSTGPHLHYEVIVGGVHVDPMPYIKEDRKEP
ncbi:M23 family metallopeptidase [Paenibacillus sp. GCM10027627]|uniref:M23 family metallopeptidase n=1 Tax=unclassified Paenibacillus TaxID=185978 RepID=UPI00362B6BEC